MRAPRAAMVLLAAALLWPSVPTAFKTDVSSYAGSDRCKECHEDKYNGWVKTFHATVVQDARKNPEAVLGDFTKPGLPFTLAEVDYTIGGHWDQRYMKKIGDDYYVLPKLWNVQARDWRSYNVWTWKKMPYSKYCKGCHVTGFDARSNTTNEHRIGCEACHGPGRSHADAKGKGPIVNPEYLTDDRKEMICAACHVRGLDASGTYYYPLGYQPGADLGNYYVPIDKQPDETNNQAIARLFGKWKEDRTSSEKVSCEVCGIYGGDDGKKEKPKGVMDFCFGCHAFKEKLPEHTRHAAAVQIVCLDCHVQQAKELMNPQNLDIHSYGYFLVHVDNCYDNRIERTCKKCHLKEGEDWARQTVDKWRKPVEVGH